MKRYKSKFMRIINFIRNEGKFEYGDMVKVKKIKRPIRNRKLLYKI